jgi:hypothetical protein
MNKYLRRRWAVFSRPRFDAHAWRERGRYWTYQGAAKYMGAAVVDRHIGSGQIFCLVDLHDGYARVGAAQVGMHDALDRWYGGPLHQPLRLEASDG